MLAYQRVHPKLSKGCHGNSPSKLRDQRCIKIHFDAGWAFAKRQLLSRVSWGLTVFIWIQKLCWKLCTHILVGLCCVPQEWYPIKIRDLKNIFDDLCFLLRFRTQIQNTSKFHSSREPCNIIHILPMDSQKKSILSLSCLPISSGQILLPSLMEAVSAATCASPASHRCEGAVIADSYGISIPYEDYKVGYHHI